MFSPHGVKPLSWVVLNLLFVAFNLISPFFFSFFDYYLFIRLTNSISLSGRSCAYRWALQPKGQFPLESHILKDSCLSLKLCLISIYWNSAFYIFFAGVLAIVSAQWETSLLVIWWLKDEFTSDLETLHCSCCIEFFHFCNPSFLSFLLAFKITQ